MNILGAISLLLDFTIVPIALGRLITYKTADSRFNRYLKQYLAGFFASLAVFYVIFAVIEWQQNWNTSDEVLTGGFTAVSLIYSIVMAVVIVFWLIRDFRNIKSFCIDVRNRLIGLKKECKTNRFLVVYGLIALALLVVQMYFSYAYEVNEWSYDDYDYVVASVDTIKNDMLANSSMYDGEMQNMHEKRASTSWTTQIAYYSLKSGFEVTTVCHTILPVLLLLVAYAAYYYMATLLIKTKENRLIFMILLQLLFIFGMHSHYSATFRLLCVLWQGKAVLCAIGVPFYTTYLMEYYSKKISSFNMISIAFVSLGLCSLTTMSIPMVGIIGLLTFVAMSIYKRKPVGVRYLLASMVGPLFQSVFYVLLKWLLEDMRSIGTYQHFPDRITKQVWWHKWFG